MGATLMEIWTTRLCIPQGRNVYKERLESPRFEKRRTLLGSQTARTERHEQTLLFFTYKLVHTLLFSEKLCEPQNTFYYPDTPTCTLNKEQLFRNPPPQTSQCTPRSPSLPPPSWPLSRPCPQSLRPASATLTLAIAATALPAKAGLP